MIYNNFTRILIVLPVFAILFIFFLFNIMRSLIIGQSWVKGLRKFESTFLANSDFIEHERARFHSLDDDLNAYANSARVRENHPSVILVMLGGNDLCSVETIDEVRSVEEGCQFFFDNLRLYFPNAYIIVSQVGYRFSKGKDGNLVLDGCFKRRSDRFNRWLSSWPGKDGLLVLKGHDGFSSPFLYCDDGINLNGHGSEKLAMKIAQYFKCLT